MKLRYRCPVRKLLIFLLTCVGVLFILGYITHRDYSQKEITFRIEGLEYIRQRIREIVPNGVAYANSTTKGISVATNKTTREQIICTARLENKTKVLNLTSILATLNRSDDQIPYLKSGGRYTPSTCQARHRVAVIVPYRDRETHLKIFLKYMHPFLQRQLLDYGIFVVESIPGVKFNRAVLLNIGYTEVKKLHHYDCFIFHDVDLLPESDVTDYTCVQSPLHLSSAIDTRKYRLPYKSYYGGVCAFKKDHFETINGFSNLYFDWGGEDDDIHERIKYSHLKPNHLSSQKGRYKMLSHEKAKPNPDKSLLFKTMRKRQRNDGLNTLKYHVIKQESKRLYTWILVSVNETQILESEPIHKDAFNNKLRPVSGTYTLRRKSSNATIGRNSINFFQNRNQSKHGIFNKTMKKL